MVNIRAAKLRVGDRIVATTQRTMRILTVVSARRDRPRSRYIRVTFKDEEDGLQDCVFDAGDKFTVAVG